MTARQDERRLNPSTSHSDVRAMRARVIQLRGRQFVAYGVLCFFLIIAVGPIVYLIAPAFRESVELFTYPFEWLPADPTLNNFRFLFEQTGYVGWAINTLVVATGVTIVTLVTCTLAAYAFAKLPFPGKRTLFFSILATLMVPIAAILAPSYLLVRGLGGLPGLGEYVGINTYGGLVLPIAVSISPLGVFMMRQFIETLPDGLYEAARMDGASEWRILRRVVLPLLKPAVVVLGIFVFMIAWANFLWAVVATTGDKFRVLTVGIASLQGQNVTNWGLIAAASLTTLIPAIVVFLVFQKWFVQASLAGALKQ